MNSESSNEPIFESPPERGDEAAPGAGGPFGNTTAHRRMVMAIASVLWGAFTMFVFYQGMMTVQIAIASLVEGLLIFELLFRTRKWLSPATLPVYILAVTLVGQPLYTLLYSILYLSPWMPLEALTYLFTNFPTNLFVWVDFAIWTGMTYFLVKLYRVDGWNTAPARSSAPALSRQEQIRDFLIGFFGWWVANILLWTMLGSAEGSYYIYNLLILPVNVIVLIVLAFRRRVVALGMLATYAVNFVIALILQMEINAYCWIPFTSR